MKPVVFLDRDGTLIEEVCFLRREEDIKVFPETPKALSLLRQAGFALIVISNQSGVARGYLTEKRVVELNRVVFNQLRMLGEVPDAFYYCPYHGNADLPEYRKDSHDRKPGTGLAEKASREFEIDLRKSYSIGDKLADVGLARNLGGKGVLLLTGHGRKEREKIDSDSDFVPDFIAANILMAAEWIVNDYCNKL